MQTNVARPIAAQAPLRKIACDTLKEERPNSATPVPMSIPPGQALPDSVPDTAGHGLRLTRDGKMLIANGSMYAPAGLWRAAGFTP